MGCRSKGNGERVQAVWNEIGDDDDASTSRAADLDKIGVVADDPMVAPKHSAHGRDIRSLDGLRAVAVTAVIMGHFLERSFARDGGLPLKLVGEFASGGVGLFFGISGFLITRLLLVEKSRGGIDLVRFYARRAVRLWPPLWIFLTAASILAAAGFVTVTSESVVAAFFFASDYLFGPTAMFHLWSLAVEEQFYLLWPVVLIFAGVRRSRHLLIAAIIAAPAIRVASYVLFPQWRGSVDYQFHQRYDVLAFGCLLAVLWSNPHTQEWIRTQSATLTAGGLAVAAAASLGNALGGGRFHLLVGFSLQAGAFAAIIAGVVTSTGLTGRLLNSPALRHLGCISYSLYLWQQIFTLTPFGIFKVPIVGLLAALLIAELSYRLIELPMEPIRRRLHSRRTVASQ